MFKLQNTFLTNLEQRERCKKRKKYEQNRTFQRFPCEMIDPNRIFQCPSNCSLHRLSIIPLSRLNIRFNNRITHSKGWGIVPILTTPPLLAAILILDIPFENQLPNLLPPDYATRAALDRVSFLFVTVRIRKVCPTEGNFISGTKPPFFAGRATGEYD